MKVDGGIGYDPTGIAQAARAAEETGYDGVWSAETGHDPFLPLAIAAASTEHLDLGTGIAVAFARNPMNLAMMANDLHGLSGGRFILGMGSQIKPHITKRYSMPWSHPAPRMRELILAIRAIWECWATGSALEFRGEYYTHTLMTPFFNPGPNPHGNPKILLAAVGPLMTEVAGEAGDGLLAHGFTTERYLREVSLPALERGAAKAGKTRADLTVSYPGFVVTGTTEADMQEATRAVKAQIAFYGSTPAYRGGPRAPRLGGPPPRAQHPVQAGRVGEDGRADRRRGARRLRRRRPARRGPRPGARPLRRRGRSVQLLRPLPGRPRAVALGPRGVPHGLTARRRPPGVRRPRSPGAGP